MEPALVTLTFAAASFVVTHFLLSHPLRAPLVGKLGANGFMAVYSLVAFATLGWTVLAFRAAPAGGVLWNGSGEVPWIIATLLMLLASVLLAGSFQGNPALPAPGAEELARHGPHGVFHITRHPMMWGFALWSFSHVLVSPTPRVVVLTLAIGVLALVGARLQDGKKEALMGDAWAAWEARTSFVPRLGALGKAGAVAWIGGIVLWLAATWAHGWLIGMPAGVWRWVG
jgi:uncharacterized membrane protein